MGYCVYVLACFINKEFRCYYVGQTNDLSSRMAEHYNSIRGHDTNNFVGRFDYVKLIWYKKVPTRADAIRLESYLKELTPSGKRDYMRNH